jgi:hypothetical protein
MPGETVVVTFHPAQPMAQDEVESGLNMLHMAQIA